MKKVGITGGIGSGKTTVVAEFERLGVPCFVADAVAAGYYRQPAFLAQLRQLFGDTVFNPDGTVDKQRIAARVFSNHADLQRLNAIVHPRVMSDFQAFCRSHASEPYVLFESAILYDYGFDRLVDRVVCVYLDLQERIRRLRERDHVDEDCIKARIANQLPAEDIMLRADYVILNYEGNPRRRQVAYIDNLLRQ